MTLSAIAGRDSKDPYTWNVAVPDYQAALTGNIRGLKVGVVQERVYSEAVEPEVKDAVIKAISVLGELGAVVQEVSIPLIVHSAAISSAIISSDSASLNRRDISEHLGEFDHNNQVRLLMGSILPGQAYQKAIKLRHLLRQQILDVLERVDVLVMPTSSIPASPIPQRAGISSKQEVLDGYAGRRSFTAPFNLANTPALSINCGVTSGDLPVGLQIAGKPFDESTLFQAAFAYEQATDWHIRRPPI
jgi:aspartyl-tRNA(Asn)/glutamyl-tRNA(Gln) amidotransferase subunit A